jgi:tetratricopeptide (TPR) repeat protein
MTIIRITYTFVFILSLLILQYAVAETSRSLVYAAYDAGDPDKAIDLCTLAIKQDPAFKYAYSARALAKREKGDLAGAITDLTKAIEISPLFADAYVWRGEIKKLQGDDAGSEADLQKAEVVRAQADHVLHDLDAALDREPDNAKKFLERAYYKKQKGDLDGAIADFDKYLSLVGRPSNHLVLFHRANAKKAKGDIDGAIDDYTVAIKMFPDDEEAYLKRAGLLKAHGRIEDGDADLEKAEQIRKEKLLRKVKQLEKRAAAARQDVGLLLQSAQAKIDAGDNEGALVDLDRVIAENENNTMAYSLRAKARKNVGDNAGSVADRKKMQELLRPSSN